MQVLTEVGPNGRPGHRAALNASTTGAGLAPIRLRLSEAATASASIWKPAIARLAFVKVMLELCVNRLYRFINKKIFMNGKLSYDEAMRNVNRMYRFLPKTT